MPRSLAALGAAAVLLGSRIAAGVTPDALAAWLSSGSGLAMDSKEAIDLAHREAWVLTQCGVTVPTLQSLKDALYDHSGIDLGMSELRKSIFPLAEQHVSPDKLKSLYSVLSSGYTISGGLALPKDKAQHFTLDLAFKRGEPDELKALYQVMYGYSGLGFKQALAQETSIELAGYGADAAQFKASYKAAVSGGASTLKALDEAVQAAVVADLQGLVRRYAKDAKPYTAKEMQAYYPSSWRAEWGDAPLEKHVSSDRKAYTASQFSRHFGSGWAPSYRVSPEATQVRLADDGKAYDIGEFQSYYRDQWQAKWSTAPELPCRECAPYAENEDVIV